MKLGNRPYLLFFLPILATSTLFNGIGELIQSLFEEVHFTIGQAAVIWAIGVGGAIFLLLIMAFLYFKLPRGYHEVLRKKSVERKEQK